MAFSLAYPFQLPELPPAIDFEDIRFNRLVAKARTELGELKSYSAALPNPMLLLSPAILRESIASSNIENVNTTVEQAWQQQLLPEAEQRPADKKVLRYGQAMRWGFEQLPTLSLSSRLIVGIQQQLLPVGYAGYRQTPNQIVNSATGKQVYPHPRRTTLAGCWATGKPLCICLMSELTRSLPAPSCIISTKPFIRLAMATGAQAGY